MNVTEKENQAGEYNQAWFLGVTGNLSLDCILFRLIFLKSNFIKHPAESKDQVEQNDGKKESSHVVC